MSSNEQNLTGTDRPHPPFLIEGAVFLAAVLGRIPALGSWWTLDDWNRLGTAAGMPGLSAGSGFPARWLSMHFWWETTWPLFGLDSDALALARLLLHGLSAVLVTRIAARAGLGSLPRLLAGLLFAVSPLAFTPLYWASGIPVLLAAFFALLAVERWLAADEASPHSRAALSGACVAAILSMFAGDAGLGLPLLMLVLMWLGIGVRLEDKAFAWAMVMFMLAAAVIEGVLVVNGIAAGPTAGPAAGGVVPFLTNICSAGWWLISPAPVPADNLSWPLLLSGGIIFTAWLAGGFFLWRRGRRVLLLTLLAALLSLGPALFLNGRFLPYYAYPASAAGALALVSLLPDRWSPRYPVLVVMTIALTIWGFTGMRIRLGSRNDLGLTADPLARATSLSWQACRTLTDLKRSSGEAPLEYLTIYQQPVTNASAEQAERFGERWVDPTDLYNALQGTVGPTLVLGPDVTVAWASGLVTNPPNAVVVCETATGLRVWGRTRNAILYAALTDIGLEHFQRARRHLVKAAALNKERVLFIFDEGQMIIPLDMVLDKKEEFVDWTVGLLGRGASPQEVGGIQDMFFNLLGVCTGQSMDELTSGSHLISSNGDTPVPPGEGE